MYFGYSSDGHDYFASTSWLCFPQSHQASGETPVKLPHQDMMQNEFQVVSYS